MEKLYGEAFRKRVDTKGQEIAKCLRGKCKSPRGVFSRKEILGMVLVGVERYADHAKS